MSAPHQWVSRKDEGDKVIVVERGELKQGGVVCAPVAGGWMGGLRRATKTRSAWWTAVSVDGQQTGIALPPMLACVTAPQHALVFARLLAGVLLLQA